MARDSFAWWIRNMLVAVTGFQACYIVAVSATSAPWPTAAGTLLVCCAAEFYFRYVAVNKDRVRTAQEKQAEARHDQLLHQLTATSGQLSALDTHRKEVSTLKVTLKKQNQDYKDLWCKYKGLEKELQLLQETRPAAHACCAGHAGSAHAQAMAKQLAHAQPLRADSMPAHQHTPTHTAATQQHPCNLSTKSHSLPTAATAQLAAPVGAPAAAKTVVHNSFGGRWLSGDLHGAVLQASVSPVCMAGPGRTLSACADPMRMRSSNCRNPSKTVSVQTRSPLRTVDSAPAATALAPASAGHAATGMQYAWIHAGACHAGRSFANSTGPSSPCRTAAKQAPPVASSGCTTVCSSSSTSLINAIMRDINYVQPCN